MTTRTLGARSFRDPDGTLLIHEGRVLRLVNADAADRVDAVLSRPVVQSWIASGKLIGTRRIDASALPRSLQDASSVVYEHDRVPFVSYAHEWSPAMLTEAAALTLELAQGLLPEGFILKDATPANVLFRGSRPVFVDILSIVKRERGAYLWLAANQFESTFLLPLIANAECGLPLQWSLQDTFAGVSHAQAARLLGWRRWKTPFLISTVAMPASLSGNSRSQSFEEPKRSNDDAAAFIFQRTLARYQRSVDRLRRRLPSSSFWKGYTSARSHYSGPDLDRKVAFVEEVVRELQPRSTLDVGANTGEFSMLAAQVSDVVALDIDESSAAAIFAQASKEDRRVQALVGNFARPSPGLGWRNAEAQSFLERANGRFDLVLMLAVVHHLRVTSGIPVPLVLETVAAVTAAHLVIEHVPPTDPMFRQIARGRESLYSDCEGPRFREHLARLFDIVRELPLGNGRTLYLARARPRRTVPVADLTPLADPGMPGM